MESSSLRLWCVSLTERSPPVGFMLNFKCIANADANRPYPVVESFPSSRRDFEIT